MTGLKCNVTSCASNAQYQCCRPDIQVAGLDAEELYVRHVALL